MDEKIEISVLTDGGAGNLIIQANFIKNFREYFENEPIILNVFGHRNQQLNDAVFAEQDFVDNYYNYSERSNGLSSDVCISLNLYPEVIYEADKVEILLPKLHNLLELWRSFIDEDASRKYCIRKPMRDYNAYLLAILNGKNCLNAADIGEKLHVGRKYRLKLILRKKEEVRLKDWKLVPGKFITIQRGATPSSYVKEGPKLWPIEHYEELIRLLKQIYPDQVIVQLGESTDHCRYLNGADINLIGKTDWEDLKILLKNAWLHIDGECGMVHMRRALSGGPSVVLFGPTPMKYYGYDENINIRSDCCPHWCARLTDTWQERCALGKPKPPCMEGIHPAMVMSEIIAWDILKAVKEKEYDYVFCRLREYNFENKAVGIPITLDQEYKENYLRKYPVYSCEQTSVQLQDLQAIVPTDMGFKWVHVEDTPCYQMLCKDSGEYELYIDLLRTEYEDKIHSPERYQELLSSLAKEGYRQKDMIIVSPDLKILDGQHRAAWLLKTHGPLSKTDALMVYELRGGWDLFPFDMVKPDSRVIIYGMSAIGISYVKQIIYTGYCKLLYGIDRNYEELNYDDQIKKIVNVYPVSQVCENIGAYDYIVIASDNARNIKDMYDSLETIGIIKTKIITKYQ